MLANRGKIRRFIGSFFAAASLLAAQESAGEVGLGFQQYYLANGGQRTANTSGLVLDYRHFLPNVGLLTASLAPAASEGRFRTGDNFLELKGLPWKRQHWTARAGDFRLQGRVLEVSFNNLFYPEIAGRGALVEATHGSRTIGFFAGGETLMVGARVNIRLPVPQTLGGVYFRQQLGSRLLLGARYMVFSNDLEEIRKSSLSLTARSRISRADSATLHSLYTLAGPLKLYGEVGSSRSTREEPRFGVRNQPLSVMAGPILETNRFTFKGNYLFQTSSYFPLLGYYLGDRRGSFAEVKFRPVSRVEIFGGANEYRNNVERDPEQPTFRSVGESAGMSVGLPGRFSVSGQLSMISLSSRLRDGAPRDRSNNRQILLNVTRPIRRHNLRLTMREFRMASGSGRERQKSAEVEDIFQIKRLVLGAGVRAQRLIARESRTSLFYRGSAQVLLGIVSAYANFETGSDLANRTVFATNTVQSTVFGGSVRLGDRWDFSVEAYRSNLISELNPQNVFVLQGQGVFVPGVLAAFNQWSVYFRMNRRFRWGNLLPQTNSTQFILRQNPLKGTVEGYVMEQTPDGEMAIPGLPVTLDNGQVVQTDSKGRYQFLEVAEGAHMVGLALQELPADFDPGNRREFTVMVKPERSVRVDLDVIRLGAVPGRIKAPEGVPVEGIVIRLLPTERYTTPDDQGNFSFFNLPSGKYEFVLDERTLPRFSVVHTPVRIPVNLAPGKEPEPAVFEVEVKPVEKPVRKVFEQK